MRRDMLRAHVRMFPGGEYTPGALYFLGRLAEGARDAASARAYYDEIVREYPNYYYTVVARERLKEIGNVAASAKVNEFLRGIDFPQRARTLIFEANATARARIERARLLASAGLDDWAVNELRYGAQNEDQPQVMAVELASLTTKTAGPDQAMRYIKRYAGSYLYCRWNRRRRSFGSWRFRCRIAPSWRRFAKANGLDPFLVAALIRQESEFNPKAVSRANARGLTQILPGTGRELSQKLKVKAVRDGVAISAGGESAVGDLLFENHRRHLGGRWEAALAAYNAGPSRARAWSSWGEFREPAEFIETVPFAETRNYIQTVLRNADTYRRIYAGGLR